MTKTITIECSACGGTGLYQGSDEKHGCAVICLDCHGTGHINFSYEEFNGRRPMKNVTRVFTGGLRGFQYLHSGEDILTEDGKTLHFSKYGCTYEEWQNGLLPKPMEELYCPYIYQNSGVGNEPCSRCADGTDISTRISKCKYFPQKEECWKEFHLNQQKNS